jgi:hypothetical protein
MPFLRIQFNDQLPHGRMLRAVLNRLEEAVDGGVDLVGKSGVPGTMTFMIDGDGSDAAQFGEVTTRFGFASNADAKAAWDELNSLFGKLNGDGSVSNVNAALLQAFAKFR